ncbi:MAG: Hsp70 family protein [Burkholderiaceae bacterium]|nr:Hsp70 family protein [Burkholderiaceae bacterium]
MSSNPHTPGPQLPSDVCAIDFGTSNSAVALPGAGGAVDLAPLEPGQVTMPTAVFYLADGPAHLAEPERLYGRAALAAYVDGLDGRLMRSMKSLLGSALLDQRTDVGAGRAVRYGDVITGYLRQLRRLGEAAAGQALHRVVLGRPVFFVDDDPARDRAAAEALAQAARKVGFADVRFQYEPIAAAFAHEAAATTEHLVLVADIGGGTSDFSLVRVGPDRRNRLEREDDILANHGVHIAGTDFDRRVELAAILPLMGHGGHGPARSGQAPREIPSGLYHDLATWHLINTVYAPARLAEWKAMRSWFSDPRQHTRLMTVLEERLGHALAAAAEQAKIDVALQGGAAINLDAVERGLGATLDAAAAARVLQADQARIVDGARETLRQAGVRADAVQALFFTGGSTGLASLVDGIAAVFPAATPVRGDRFASVATGLGLHARRVFSGGTSAPA